MTSKNLLVLCHDPNEQWPIELTTVQNFELWVYDYTSDSVNLVDTIKKINTKLKIEKIINRKQKGKGQIFKDLACYDLSAYEYIGVFDGDCLTTTGDINKLFDTGAKHEWHWFQPALQEGSYYSYKWTVQNQYDQFCYTTTEGDKFHLAPFVEIMCPVFSSDLWEFLKPVHKFYDYISGYGLDNGLVPAALPYFVEVTFPIVFEGSLVKHSKPVSNANKKLDNGLSAYEEMDYTLTFCSEVIQGLYRLPDDYNLATFCISLKESKERRAQFKKHADGCKLDFKFFNAADYRGFQPGQYPTWVSANGIRADWHEPLTPGEVGCAVSHKLLYEIGLMQGDEDSEVLDALVIFEDDAIIQEPIKTEIPIDADLVMLSNRWHHNHNFEVVGGSCGTEGYIITRSGMYKMLQILQNMDMPLDLIMIAHCQSMIESKHGLCSVRNELNPVLKIYHRDVFCTHDDSVNSTLH